MTHPQFKDGSYLFMVIELFQYGTDFALSGLNLQDANYLENLERTCYIDTMMTLLNRIDPAQNMNRWYLVSVQTTLFSSCAVVIAWGRRDTEFQQWRTLSVESRGDAEQLAAKIIQHKLKRGYRVCEQPSPPICG